MRSAPRAGDAGGFLGLVGDHAAAVAGALWRRRFERALDRIVLRTQPDLVHAHSPYECGLPALRIARRYRLPLVYEVRGIWEESRVAQEGEAWRDTRIYRWQREAESAVMIQANAVVCISTQLRQEILARGVPDSRVVVVPNAVDPSVFRPLSAATADVPEEIRDVRRRLKGLTLGYVGNLRTLEGVDELVRGAAELVRRGREVSLLVVGSGDGGEGLKVLARDLGIGDRAVFTGQVPHHQIALYYDLIDVFVVSRPALRVTNLVTPLKPLEAMAMARPLVVSDLPALRELVIEDDTGLFYPPGDVAKLADVCARLLDDAALRRRLGEKARNWVLENRTWPIVLRGLYPVYKSLLGPTFTESSCALQSL
jgi:glycosyltransferase involved in cell wall biosynthesis